MKFIDNICHGQIDIGGQVETDDSGYGYTTKIYNNSIGWATLQPYYQRGITIEGTNIGCYIYANYIYNVMAATYFNTNGVNVTQTDICCVL